MVEPHRPDPCEVANSVAVFRLTRRIAKVKLDRKAAGLSWPTCQDSAQPQAWTCLIDVSKILPGYHVECQGRFALAGISDRLD